MHHLKLSDEDGSIEGSLQPQLFTLSCVGNIIVTLQQEHRGTYSIPSSLADRLCADLGVEQMLADLNAIFGTSYTLQTPGLFPVIDQYVAQEIDFGTAYGQLLPWWKSEQFETLRMTWKFSEDRDRAMRRDAIVNGRIVDSHMPPRRVWDLYSNRVIPMWVIEPDTEMEPGDLDRALRISAAVSHSWCYPWDRHKVLTPINGRQWPVPIPLGVDLENVRIELLNLGAQYVWLDVLCLRQQIESEASEDLRAEEWKVDVPTIGVIYTAGDQVVTYFNGLGRPFQEADLDSPRHWCNRAWTLQEYQDFTMTVAGITPDSPHIDMKKLDLGQYGESQGFSRDLATRIRSMHGLDCYTFRALREMRHRSAEKEVDKIAGLAYYFFSYELPPYFAAASPEDAWEGLVHTMGAHIRADIFFRVPAAGDGRYKWMLSWNQILTIDLPELEETTGQLSPYRDENGNFVTIPEGYFIERCETQGFATLDGNFSPRQGTVHILDDSGIRFNVVSPHRDRFPDGEYALLGTITDRACKFWVVGRIVESGRFVKVSVLEIASYEECKSLRAKLGRDMNNPYMGSVTLA